MAFAPLSEQPYIAFCGEANPACDCPTPLQPGTMLDTVSSPGIQYEDQSQGRGFDPSYFIGIAKRRIVHFAVPFLLVLAIGSAFIAIQRPLFQAAGEILLQSPGIAPELVHPTVTELTDERFEVFRQRILSGQNLMALVEKYNLFPRERESVSGLELLDLMRQRVGIKPVEPLRASSPTIAFAISFDYEVPATALNVANELLTEILSEDANRRSSSATEATRVLEEEVKRLQEQHAAVVAQIEAIRQQPPDREQQVSEERKAQLKSLADLQAELVQKSSVYSDEYPAVKELRRKIAALKLMVGTTPTTTASAPRNTDRGDLEILERQESRIQSTLGDANGKLAAARLGENLEKNQQAQRLRVIQYPELPYRPVKPKKLKWLAIVFVLAGMAGAALVVLAEMLDRSIRRSSELSTIVDKHFIVSIPYMWAPGEERRRRWRFVLVCVLLVTLTFALLGTALLLHLPSGSTLYGQPLVYALSGILK